MIEIGISHDLFFQRLCLLRNLCSHDTTFHLMNQRFIHRFISKKFSGKISTAAFMVLTATEDPGQIVKPSGNQDRKPILCRKIIIATDGSDGRYYLTCMNDIMIQQPRIRMGLKFSSNMGLYVREEFVQFHVLKIAIVNIQYY